jgi:threonine dehydratase
MLSEPDLLEDVRRADTSLTPYIRRTPLVASTSLGRDPRAPVLLKLENLQVTGSFKVRGALNKVFSLPKEARTMGVVAASTGNHGAGVAYAASTMGLSARIFVPESVAERKLARIVEFGADVVRVPGDPLNAETAARSEADRNGSPYISPYNDPAIIAGQGTVGLEIVRQCATPVDAVFVPLGGGGLSAGVAIAIKSTWPDAKVIGCSPENSCAMVRSLEAGEIVDAPSRPTISDGTAGGIEPGSITFELCRRWLDEMLTVSEDEIAEALRSVVESESLVVEGAAAVAVAGYKKFAARHEEGQSVVIILSGGNVSRRTLVEILSGSWKHSS